MDFILDEVSVQQRTCYALFYVFLSSIIVEYIDLNLEYVHVNIQFQRFDKNKKTGKTTFVTAGFFYKPQNYYNIDFCSSNFVLGSAVSLKAVIPPFILTICSYPLTLSIEAVMADRYPPAQYI